MASANTPFRQRVSAWVIWFRLIGAELEKAPAGLTTQELARTVAPARGVDQNDRDALKKEAKSIGGFLQGLSQWGLVSGEFVERPLPDQSAEPVLQEEPRQPSARPSRIVRPPRITPPPVQVAKLRKKGERLLRSPGWRQHLFFAGRLVADFKIWKPLQTALAVSGGLVTVLKMILLWQSHHTAIVAGASGALVFVIQWMRGRDA